MFAFRTTLGLVLKHFLAEKRRLVAKNSLGISITWLGPFQNDYVENKIFAFLFIIWSFCSFFFVVVNKHTSRKEERTNKCSSYFFLSCTIKQISIHSLCYHQLTRVFLAHKKLTISTGFVMRVNVFLSFFFSNAVTYANRDEKLFILLALVYE